MSLPTTNDPVIQVRGLRKVYGAKVAVDALDLDVPRGSVFGLLGPNGAGKSTTFGVLCGWQSADAGDVRILGTPPARLHELRGRVAALPQDAHFPATMRLDEQLTHFARLQGLAPNVALAEARRALEAVGLADSAHLRGSELSHGMHKRAGLAQALLGSPEVLLLDEPTSGLDPRTARAIKDLIASLAPRATVLLSSHNLAEVQELCTHAAILDHGRLSLTGSMDALVRRGTEFSVLLAEPSAAGVRALTQAGFEVLDPKSPTSVTLRVRAPEGHPDRTAIPDALRALLKAGAAVLEVRRGTSLEAAFLEQTAQGSAFGTQPDPQPGTSATST